MRQIDLISQCNIIYHANHKRYAHTSQCLKVTLISNIPSMPPKCPAAENCFNYTWKEATETQLQKAPDDYEKPPQE